MGVTLLVFGALLAWDGRNGVVPAALGILILGYWYLVEREPEEVPLEEVDYRHGDPAAMELIESSTCLDLADLKPFLERLLKEFSGGYTRKAVAHLVDRAGRMKPDEECHFEYEAAFQGERWPLKIGLFKDDVGEVAVYFHSPQPLIGFIDREMAAFFDERGM